MYAYCRNNPVNMSDASGNWPISIKDGIKWLAKNVVKPIIDKTESLLSKCNYTYSTGVNLSGTPGIFFGNIQGGMSVDTKGNVGLQGSIAVGVTGTNPGYSGSVTVYQMTTNAPSIDKLESMGYQIGGTVGVPVEGIPVALGGDFNIIPDSELGKTYYGTTSNAGIGSVGMEFHVGWGNTETWDISRFNVFDIMDDIYIKIMEW